MPACTGSVTGAATDGPAHATTAPVKTSARSKQRKTPVEEVANIRPPVWDAVAQRKTYRWHSIIPVADCEAATPTSCLAHLLAMIACSKSSRVIVQAGWPKVLARIAALCDPP